MANVVVCTSCEEPYDLDFNEKCPSCGEPFNEETALEDLARDEYNEYLSDQSTKYNKEDCDMDELKFEDDSPLEEEQEDYSNTREYRENNDETFFKDNE